jgi:hypothetical protein
MEQLRDRSHVRMPPRRVVGRWLQEHGLVIDGVVAEREIDRPLRFGRHGTTFAA